jgi:hypothetical protein
MRANRMERRVKVAGVVLLGRGGAQFARQRSGCVSDLQRPVATLIAAGILLFLHGLVSGARHLPSDADR